MPDFSRCVTCLKCSLIRPWLYRVRTFQTWLLRVVYTFTRVHMRRPTSRWTRSLWSIFSLNYSWPHTSQLSPITRQLSSDPDTLVMQHWRATACKRTVSINSPDMEKKGIICKQYSGSISSFMLVDILSYAACRVWNTTLTCGNPAHRTRVCVERTHRHYSYRTHATSVM